MKNNWCIDGEYSNKEAYVDVRNNVCDGTDTDCYNKGTKLCDDIGDACHGVNYHPATQLFLVCKKKGVYPKHDGWNTLVKTGSGKKYFEYFYSIKVNPCLSEISSS